MPHKIRSLFSSRRVRSGLVAVAAGLTLAASVLLPAVPVAAQNIDSAVVINIRNTNGSNTIPMSVAFYTTQHGFGNCTAAAGTFYVNSGSRTCTGEQFGPPTQSNPNNGVYLYLSSVPSGYTFNGFTTVGYPNNGSVGCSNYCYMNFSSGSITVYANFTPVSSGGGGGGSSTPSQPSNPGSSTPAKPSAPKVSVWGRSANGISLAWSIQSIPGGVKRWDVFRDGQIISTQTTQSFTDSGLKCNTGYGYTVRVTDNYNQQTMSAPVSASTLACPAAASGSGGSSSSSTKKSSSSSSSSTSGGNVAGTSTSNTTATSSTTTDTPGPNSFEDDVLSSDTDKSSDDISNEDEQPAKKGIPMGIKILVVLFGLGILAGVWWFLTRNKSGNDYWTQPPSY